MAAWQVKRLKIDATKECRNFFRVKFSKANQMKICPCPCRSATVLVFFFLLVFYLSPSRTRTPHPCPASAACRAQRHFQLYLHLQCHSGVTIVCKCTNHNRSIITIEFNCVSSAFCIVEGSCGVGARPRHTIPERLQRTYTSPKGRSSSARPEQEVAGSSKAIEHPHGSVPSSCKSP